MHFKPLVPDFLFQRNMWLVLLIRTSGECIKINFHFTVKCLFNKNFSYTVPLLGR